MTVDGWQRIEELRRKVGHLDVVFGTRVSRIEGGPGDGVVAVSVWNAAGLRLEIFVNRGFDIFSVEHRGRPVHWQGPPGLRSRFSYEPQGWGWLRNFHGGLLMTCGLDHILFPYTRKAPEYDFLPDMAREYGLHGRIANEAGELLERAVVDLDGQPFLRVRGRVIQAALYHERLALERTIEVPVFGSEIRLTDEVVNIGFNPTHHEVLYHINYGYPLVDVGTTVQIPTREGSQTITVDDVSARAEEVVTSHDAPPGGSVVTVTNRQLAIKVDLEYDSRLLPYFFVWNMRAEGVNAIGLEPSSTRRATDRSEDVLDLLEPGARVGYRLRFAFGDPTHGPSTG